MTTDATGAPSRPVDAIADAYVDDYCALDPVAATYLGVPGHEHRLTDYSPAGYAAREALARTALAAATATTASDEREEIAREAFLERLGVEVEMYDAKIPQSQLSVVESGLYSIRSVLDLMDTSDDAGWENVDQRLASFAATLDGYRTTLEECAAAGHVAARRQILEVAEQARSWTGQRGTSGDFFAKLVDGSGREGALRERLARHAREASDATAGFGRWLSSELAPRGREVEACGEELYQLGSRYFLGTTIDLHETYTWGWQELARIEDEMARVADEIVPGGGVDEAVTALDADPARNITGREAFAAWMQDLADRTMADMADVHFDIPEPVRRIECRIAPTADGGIYYTGPSEDFSRPGRMWWAVPDSQNVFSTWREVTTVFHEGVPGHHLQVGQTVARRETLNRWQRLKCWVAGHGEGWALYSERLMDDLGYLDDPGDKLGMLDAQGFRAARVIIDIGMHLQLEIPRDNPFGFHPGQTWDRELGLQFLREHSRTEEDLLAFEINRYLGWPGQAPAYKVGERIWLQARDDARARLGDAFDLKAFHRAALDLGSIGLDPLQTALARIR